MEYVYRNYFAPDKPLRHYTQHFLLDFFGLFAAYFLAGEFTVLNVCTLFVMSYIVDLDPFLTLFIQRKRYAGFYSEVMLHLRKLNLMKAGEVAVTRHKELNTLLIHNYVAFPFFWMALYYCVYANSSPVLIYTLCGMITHFIFDICDDVYQLGHINNWLWPFIGVKKTNSVHDIK